jgi:hypothetical protein
MLQHYVCIKYRAGTGDAHIAGFTARMFALRQVIGEIVALDIGRDILHDARSWDLVLIMQFESVDTLRRYQQHPEHLKVMEFNQPCVEAVASVDFLRPY